MQFEESAWSYPVVIGLADAGLWDAIFAVLLLLLNMRRLAKYLQNRFEMN